MSTKRQATSELNHDNWDEEDAPVERGHFRQATEDEIKSRVIKKARRKITKDAGGIDDTKKSIFSAFPGFTKDTKSGGSGASPFSFLAKLPTQETAPKLQFGGATAAASTTTKDGENPTTSSAAATSSFSFFPQSSATTKTTTVPITSSKNIASNPITTFSFNATKSTPDKASASAGTVASSPMFSSSTQVPNANNSFGSSLFTSSSGMGASTSSKSIFGGREVQKNADDTAAQVPNDSPEILMLFKANLKVLNEQFSAWIQKNVNNNPVCLLTPVFRDYELHLNDIIKEVTQRNSISDKPAPVEKKRASPVVEAIICLSDDDEDERSSSSDEKIAQKQSSSSKSLNSYGSSTEKPAAASTSWMSTNAPSSSTSWMNTTVPSSSTSYMTTAAASSSTPTFSFSLKSTTTEAYTNQKETPSSTAATLPTFNFGVKKTNDIKQQGSISSSTPATSTTFTFGLKKTDGDTQEQKPFTLAGASPTFSFGLKKSNDPDNTPTVETSTTSKITSPQTGIFSFGEKKPTESTDSNGFKSVTKPLEAPAFSFGVSGNSSVGGIGATTAPAFSFGGGAPSFNFGNIKPPPAATESTSAANANDEDESDTPPKVEFTKVVEDDAIYSKKCKVYVKKGESFVDRGVGTLYLKPVKATEKTQLLVRADTNLGNILINTILTKGIPTQKNGKNNVMLVCVPTPDEEKPTPILLRVKTSEDADELLVQIQTNTK